MFVELLKRKLSGTGPDVVLLRVSIQGQREGIHRTLSFNLVDFYQENDNISAMMRTTAFPTSVIAQLIVRDAIPERGVRTPEQCVPLEPLLAELRRRNVNITMTWK